MYGRQPVLELLDTEASVDKIFMQQNAHGEILLQIMHKAGEKGIPVQKVPQEKLSALTGGNHQGVIAMTTEVHFYTLEQMLPFLVEAGKTPLFLILDGITDVRNFGAIARTAHGAGVDAIIIPFSHSAPLNADAVKTSAGTLRKIPLCRERNMQEALAYLSLNGIRIFGADAHADLRLRDADLSVPLALVIGSEESGISGTVRKHLDATLRIPISEDLDSYNVSVSAGMLLYEVMRQRNRG